MVLSQSEDQGPSHSVQESIHQDLGKKVHASRCNFIGQERCDEKQNGADFFIGGDEPELHKVGLNSESRRRVLDYGGRVKLVQSTPLYWEYILTVLLLCKRHGHCTYPKKRKYICKSTLMYHVLHLTGIRRHEEAINVKCICTETPFLTLYNTG